jgi:hypothetical protein
MEARFLLWAPGGADEGEADLSHKLLFGDAPATGTATGTGAGALNRQPTLNVLIRHWFDSGLHKYVKYIFALQHGTPRFTNKDFAGELFFPH